LSRKLAIGDIHGCLNSLKTLLTIVAPTAEDTVIMLGDYVDRGSDSNGVIDYLINWPWEAKLVLLKGNHEIIMSEATFSAEHLTYWCSVGGLETIASYDAKFANIPKSHWEFIEKGQASFETKKVIYVHGGVALVVCGHTVQRKGIPTDAGHTICIDTAACRGGWLTCLEAKTRRYWQANEKGRARKGVLKERKGSKQGKPSKPSKISSSQES
jgi:serine/threonine protein phosphatase 1